MKILAAFILTVAIAAGGVAAYYFIMPQTAAAKPQPVSTQHCVDKVMYVVFSNAATVKYRPDGRIWTCGGV